MGIIGIAWFWNRQEPDYALNPLQPFAEDDLAMRYEMPAASAGAPSGKMKSRPATKGAGTGMGREQRHHVKYVTFDPDAGMFSVCDVMKIYYQFAGERELPQPFIDEDRETVRFAPQMPGSK